MHRDLQKIKKKKKKKKKGKEEEQEEEEEEKGGGDKERNRKKKMKVERKKAIYSRKLSAYHCNLLSTMSQLSMTLGALPGVIPTDI